MTTQRCSVIYLLTFRYSSRLVVDKLNSQEQARTCPTHATHISLFGICKKKYKNTFEHIISCVYISNSYFWY